MVINSFTNSGKVQLTCHCFFNCVVVFSADCALSDNCFNKKQNRVEGKCFKYESQKLPSAAELDRNMLRHLSLCDSSGLQVLLSEGHIL